MYRYDTSTVSHDNERQPQAHRTNQSYNSTRKRRDADDAFNQNAIIDSRLDKAFLMLFLAAKSRKVYEDAVSCELNSLLFCSWPSLWQAVSTLLPLNRKQLLVCATKMTRRPVTSRQLPGQEPRATRREGPSILSKIYLQEAKSLTLSQDGQD